MGVRSHIRRARRAGRDAGGALGSTRARCSSSCVGAFLYSRRDWEREHASRLAVLAVARGGPAQPPAGFTGVPLAAPISGRPALAWHVDVVTRERRPSGNAEQIVVTRIHEESQGAFAVAEAASGTSLPFSMEGAFVVEAPVADALADVTLFASSTSMCT